MKLVIASGIYPPDIGGPAIYSQLIAREFSKQGIDVEVICYSNKKKEVDDKKEKFSITRIPRNYIKLSRYFLYFIHLLRLAKNADVIYAQGPLGAGLPAMWVSRILKKKFVVKIVGDYAWEQGVNQWGVKELIESFQKRKYHKGIEIIRDIQKKVIKNADKIIVPSEFLKKIVSNWGVSKSKIKVIYNASPRQSSKSVGGRAKIKALKGDIIVSAGRLEPWKGMDTIVEIMPELLKKNPNFKLIIVGHGSLEKKIKSQITRYKLGRKVKLIDRLSHDELMAYFGASNMFVLNTGYEGLSHIILEALSMELPVITTNVCGNPEVVKNNYNGLLVEYNNKTQLKNAILKLWEDKELQKKFIKNGKSVLDKFKLEEMLKQTLKILEL